MNNDIYPNTEYVNKLCDLFDKNIYNKIILKKHTTKTQPDLIFETNDNTESKFIIKFISKSKIEITIPIKNKNYLYTTNFYPQEERQNLNTIYNYLKYHIYVNYQYM